MVWLPGGVGRLGIAGSLQIWEEEEEGPVAAGIEVAAAAADVLWMCERGEGHRRECVCAREGAAGLRMTKAQARRSPSGRVAHIVLACAGPVGSTEYVGAPNCLCMCREVPGVPCECCMGFASATLVCPGELAGARREEAPSRVGMCASRRRGCRVSCGRAARAGAGSLRSGSNSGPAPLSAVSGRADECERRRRWTHVWSVWRCRWDPLWNELLNHDMPFRFWRRAVPGCATCTSAHVPCPCAPRV